MDKRMGFDVDYMLSHKLGLDDTFQFRCKACGKCCKHRDDVLLTPYDLFRIARYLVRTPQEIVDRYCDTYDGHNSHLPIVRVQPTPPDNACPFLRDRKCMVHKDKPLVCAVFPLARVTGTEGPFYVLQPDVDCGGKDRTVSVRNWIGHLLNEESEQFAALWFEVIQAVTRPLMKKWERLDEAHQERILTVFYNLFYLSYDIKNPFLPQFKKNASHAMLYAISYGTIDIPEWAQLPDSEDLSLLYPFLLNKAYFRYRRDWCE